MSLQRIRTRVSHADGESGFTLIELLVVMLILGILAAIALPAFFNQKGKASDAKAKEYAHSAQVAMETCATENSGEYTNCKTTVLEAIEPTLKSATFVAEGLSASGYTIKVTSNPTTQTFSVKRETSGEVVFPCTVAGKGGCPTGTQGWAKG